jgi:ribosome-binding protein aMBF1 (putative translation factor)
LDRARQGIDRRNQVRSLEQETENNLMAMQSRGGAKTVGRKREGQPKSVRGTPAGKFGQRLEALMMRAGLTTTELSARIGITPDTLRKYIRGVLTPDIDRWPDVARALGLKNAKELLPDLPVN